MHVTVWQTNVFGNGEQSKKLSVHPSWCQGSRERTKRDQNLASKIASLYSANENTEEKFASLQMRSCKIRCEGEATRKPNLSMTICYEEILYQSIGHLPRK